jgi:hypothetical protein
MAHQVLVEIPDAVYQPIMQQAQETGQPPAEVINEWLARVAAIRQDRLRRWAGVFASGVPDAAGRHHEYLGRALLPESQGKQDG